MTIDLLERVAHHTVFGMRLRDVVTGRPVVDHIVIRVIPPFGQRRYAVRSPSGVFSVRALPSLPEWEMRDVAADGTEVVPTDVAPVPLRVEVRDVSGSFHSFFVETDVPFAGLLSAPCGSPPTSPPEDAAIPLFSLPSRPVPAATAVVRARLAHATDGTPAAFACLEVTVSTGGESYRGVADHRGDVVVMFPYPRLPGLAGSPPTGSKRTLSSTTWPITIQAYLSNVGRVSEPNDLPDLCSFVDHVPATLSMASSPPGPLHEATLEYGRELVLRSSGDDPVLLLGAVKETAMPEYLAPGVFVEEVSYRAKSIEGVSTTTTGFIGPTRYGPTDVEPEIITSLVEYERVVRRSRQQLEFADRSAPIHNYMWHAVRAFFENGGKRLYVQRVFDACQRERHGLRSRRPQATGNGLDVRSRFPGRGRQIGGSGSRSSSGRTRWRSSARRRNHDAAEHVAARDAGAAVLAWSSQPRRRLDQPADRRSPPDERTGEFYLAPIVTATGSTWTFTDDPAASKLNPDSLPCRPRRPRAVRRGRVVTATVTVFPTDEDDPTQVWSGLPLDASTVSFGANDSLFYQFEPEPGEPRLAPDDPDRRRATRSVTGRASTYLRTLLRARRRRAPDCRWRRPGRPSTSGRSTCCSRAVTTACGPAAASYEGDQREPRRQVRA